MKFITQVLVLLAICVKLSVNQGTNVLTPPYTCTTTICQPGQFNQAGANTNTYQNKPGKRGVPGQRGEKGEPCQCDVLDERVVATLREEWTTLKKHVAAVESRLNKVEGVIEDLPENCSKYMSARAHLKSYNVVAIYPMKFIDDLSPFMTDCKTVLADGKDGWIPIQRRKDGGTDFYRNWKSYADGFGDREGEFWIGLKNLHLMTTAKTCKLRIDIRYWDKTIKYAEYSIFEVSDEASFFRLRVSGFSGNIHDSMAHHNGRKFSTFDQDNDDHGSAHCAQVYTSGWWHGTCHDSNLNGQYFKTKTNNNKGVWWDNFSHSLSYVEMKILCI